MKSLPHLHNPAARARAHLGAIGAIAAIAALASAALPASAAAGSTPEGPEVERLGPGETVASGEVVVSYEGAGNPRVVPVPEDESVRSVLSELRADPGVRWADPNPVATVSGWIPDDPGKTGPRGGWRKDQWNFLPPPGQSKRCTEARPCGVDAPRAWKLLRKGGHPEGRREKGKRGPIVAVVDTGVAYRDKGDEYRRSPDLSSRTFVAGRDFVGDDSIPLDRNGHGTHVASTVAEGTDNGRYVTGLGDGLRIMPVRVLAGNGAGTAVDVARGIRFATRHDAKVINLSLEFAPGFDSCDGLRVVCEALDEAREAGVFVVGAAGNAALPHAQMPGREAYAVASGTIRGCISRFSSRGEDIGITAPGGGVDAPGAGSQCVAHGRGPGIVQLTLKNSDGGATGFLEFGYPHYEGTSMAAPHVSAAAALVMSSKLLKRKVGHRPRPREIATWLGCSARAPYHETTAFLYGAGLLDLGAALDRHTPCPKLKN
jgi:serine protease